MSYDEFLIALENILNDKVVTVPTVRIRKIDTSATMETGMAAKVDGENLREEGDHRIVDLALLAVNKGTGKGKGSLGKGQSWSGYQGDKGGKDSQQGGKKSWQKGSGKTGSSGQGKRGTGENRAWWICGKNRTHCSVVSNGRQQEFVGH